MQRGRVDGSELGSMITRLFLLIIKTRKLKLIGSRLGLDILAPPWWSRLETEVSMDPKVTRWLTVNGLRSRMLQPICKFRSGQSSNPGAGTPAGAPLPLDQSNLVHVLILLLEGLIRNGEVGNPSPKQDFALPDSFKKSPVTTLQKPI
ncbi:hypothetical protein YC2023_084773 [Brassica napus]